jgi:hypothetical protein
MQLPSGLEDFSHIIIDSYFIVDRERTIVAVNRTFHAMLPRAVARSVKGKKCYDVLQLGICKEGCIAEQCWKANAHVRLDEIDGSVAGVGEAQRFILSAIPLRDGSGNLVGAMEVQRNVTDEALVQVKYQQQVEASTKQQAQLELELHRRTARLLEVSRRLLEAKRQLIRFRTDLFG